MGLGLANRGETFRAHGPHTSWLSWMFSQFNILHILQHTRTWTRLSGVRTLSVHVTGSTRTHLFPKLMTIWVRSWIVVLDSDCRTEGWALVSINFRDLRKFNVFGNRVLLHEGRKDFKEILIIHIGSTFADHTLLSVLWIENAARTWRAESGYIQGLQGPSDVM